MKLLMLAATFVSFSASATDWQYITSGDNVAVGYDPSSIMAQGAYRKAWLLWNYDTPTTRDIPKKITYSSSKALNYFDCASKQMGNYQAVYYTGTLGTGENIDSFTYKFNPSTLSDVVPGTIGEEILRTVCAHRLKSK